VTLSDTRRVDDGLGAAPAFEITGDVAALLGSRCSRCGTVAFPRRSVCIRCCGPQEPFRLSGWGTLQAWTRLANPPHGFDRAIQYGCVDLDEGPRVLAILGDEMPRAGQRVRARPATVRYGALGFRFDVDA
jgi:uncharacterized OB-fold protein